MTDWNTWARIVDAAQDPRQRDVVQAFLTQTELSAEIPRGIDERFLAPRRSGSATDEQGAYLLCNLGFAALVAGSKASAEFAMACGQVSDKLAPEVPDLVLRRRFLSTKGTLVIAVLADQPHIGWIDVAVNCAGYISAIDRYIDVLPGDSVEGNAMAAYSFAGQFLTHIRDLRSAEYYAAEVGRLVSVALGLAGRLPATLVARIWRSTMLGTDAGAFFREMGAAAERTLQPGDDSMDHARQGLRYLDEILSQSGDKSGHESGRLVATRAELLLMAGQHAEAMQLIDELERLPDDACRGRAIVLRAKHRLLEGDPGSAIELLVQLSASEDRAEDTWCATWMRDANDGHWTNQPQDGCRPVDDRETWELRAVVSAELNDMPAVLAAADRFGGFLVDSILQDRQAWVERVRPSIAGRTTFPEQPAAPVIEPTDLVASLDDVFARLVEGTALVHVVNGEACTVTSVTRQVAGEVEHSVASDKRGAARLREAQKTWSQACLIATEHNAADTANDTGMEAAFSGLMDEVRRIWGELLQDLLDDDVTQLVFVGDGLVDIPLHAMQAGDGQSRLIDHLPVTFVPSISLLRACAHRTPVDTPDRTGIQLVGFVEEALDSGDVETLAAILSTGASDLAVPAAASRWGNPDSPQVLHISARLNHNATLPFESKLTAGEREHSIAELVAHLDLRNCEIVSGFTFASVLPSPLRAPGFDLAALLLAVGARNVLASSWETKHEITSKMTHAFFEGWVTGQQPAVAFRQAIQQLRTGQPSIPDHAWAGMRLVGAP